MAQYNARKIFEEKTPVFRSLNEYIISEYRIHIYYTVTITFQRAYNIRFTFIISIIKNSIHRQPTTYTLESRNSATRPAPSTSFHPSSPTLYTPAVAASALSYIYTYMYSAQACLSIGRSQPRFSLLGQPPPLPRENKREKP